MTRDEIRGLIGGYATGSLSTAERKALFEAALDDQELFDALAREQALKELLDQPGVKARLLTALAPRPRPWRAKAWVWTAAAAFATAVIAGILFMHSAPRQVEIARVELPPAPVAPPEPVQAKPPVAAPEPVPVAAPKAEKPPPAPAELALPPQAQSASVGALGAVSGAAPAGGGGGRGGGRGGAARLLTPAAAARFAFDYSVTPDGALRIVAAANGFLTVGANNGSTMSVLFNNRLLQAGSVTEVPLPADCVSALAIFSAREMPPGLLNFTSPADAASGTKSDPNPTPDSVLIATVPVKR